ncbi:MAG TPA: FxLYD domain-containing protein [Methylomirabilota bacterium]|nr:FxLYD domain-containing protein [Methylomirabilota bacterium]
MFDEKKRQMPIAFLLGVVIIALLVVGVVLYSRHASSAAGAKPQRLPMGPQEQAYVANIKFTDPKMSRASNFLNQEVTFIFGTVENDGPRPIRQIEVTIEFHDEFNQVVLRDTQRLLAPESDAIGPGQQRDFQLSYEHISDQWNVQYPTMKITGLDLK